MAGQRRRAQGAQPRTLLRRAKAGRRQPLSGARPLQRLYETRAGIPRKYAKAQRVDRRAGTWREADSRAQDVHSRREAESRDSACQTSRRRATDRRRGRLHALYPLQVEARAIAREGAPDARHKQRRLEWRVRRRSRQSGSRHADRNRCPRGQEGRTRERAAPTRAQARHPGGRPRDPGKRDGRRPGKRARGQGEDSAD